MSMSRSSATSHQGQESGSVSCHSRRKSTPIHMEMGIYMSARLIFCAIEADRSTNSVSR